MTLLLTVRREITAPLSMRSVSVDYLQGLPTESIASALLDDRLGQMDGNRIGDWFTVEGDLSDGRLLLRGDLINAHHIAAEHALGDFSIEGSVGDFLANKMRGGTVAVRGSAGNYVASGMRAGLVAIEGNAGEDLAGPMRGERAGMRGGCVVVNGSVGSNCGHRLRRGMIVVHGHTGEQCGWEMIAGTIVIGGKHGDRLGLSMRRGTIILATNGFPGTARESVRIPLADAAARLLGRAIAEVLKAVEHADEDSTIALLAKGLQQQPQSWSRVQGDRSVNGLGEIVFR